MGSRFRERPCLKKVRVSLIRDTQHQPLASTHTHTREGETETERGREREAEREPAV